MFQAAYRFSTLGLVTLGPLHLAQRRLPTVHIVTRWSGSGGIEAYLSGNWLLSVL